MSIRRPPDRCSAGALHLRVLLTEDAGPFAHACLESLPELTPFMAWASEEHTTASKVELVARWADDRRQGTQFQYGLFCTEDGVEVLVGTAGLMTRPAPGTLEIGYWVRTSHTHRGFATLAAAALTAEAFRLPGIERVVIRHDRANLASRRVPEKLGFGPVGDQRYEPTAPGQDGVLSTWSIDRTTWAHMSR